MDFLIGILNVLIVLGSLFLVCVILIQRGKGGGLAGAFGGVGGSSAFGTKAGDVFTKITIGVAVGWMLTAMLLVVLMNRHAGSASSGWGNDSTSASKELSRRQVEGQVSRRRQGYRQRRPAELGPFAGH